MLSKTSAALLASILAIVPVYGCDSQPYQGDTINTAVPRVGDAPVVFGKAGASAHVAQGGTLLFVPDEHTGYVHRFTLDPLALAAPSIPLVLNGSEPGLLVAESGAYYIELSSLDYALVKTAGGSVKNPLPLQGTISTAAFDRVHNRLVLMDSFTSILLLQLTDAGDVESDWLGGPVLGAAGATIKTGSIAADGQVVFGLSDGSFARVDLAKTLQAQAWVYTTAMPPPAKATSTATASATATSTATASATATSASTASATAAETATGTGSATATGTGSETAASGGSDPGTGGATPTPTPTPSPTPTHSPTPTPSPTAGVAQWIGAGTAGDEVLVLDDQRIYTYDVVKHALVDEVSLNGGTAQLASERGLPHVVVRNPAGTYTINFLTADGKLHSSLLPQAMQTTTPLYTELDPDGQTLTASYNQTPAAVAGSAYGDGNTDTGSVAASAADSGYTPQTLYRVRLVDALVVGQTSFSDPVRIASTGAYIVAQYDSTMGLIERMPFNRLGDRVEYSGYNLPYLRGR